MKFLCAAAVLAFAQDAAKPTPYHDFLKQFEGTWDATVKMYGDPSKPPVESKGVETSRLDLNGLWLVFDFKCEEMMGQPFKGHGVWGYDVQKRKYVGLWVDSMIASMDVSEGTCDEKGKVFTFISEMSDPNGKKQKARHIYEIKDKDTKLFTFNMVLDGGKEFTVMTIEYKRRK
jgi:hypothetical protein